MPGSPEACRCEDPLRRRRDTPAGPPRPPLPRDAGHRRGAAAAALLLPLLAAGPSATAEQPRHLRSCSGPSPTRPTEYQVPQSVLLGVSYLQSRWDAHDGAPSVSGGYGPMHLTDARTALADGAAHHSERHGGRARRRGPPARCGRAGHAEAARAAPSSRPGCGPAERAAKLTGLWRRAAARRSRAANVRGGAALLAAAQKKLGRPLSADPADWYGAVAASPARRRHARRRTAFADDVFDVMRTGEQRTTDAGQRVALDGRARPGAPTSAGGRPGERAAGAPTRRTSRVPADRVLRVDPGAVRGVRRDGDYGNHDKADRPASASPSTTSSSTTPRAPGTRVLDLVQDPTYVSWNYTLRSSDGHIAQHVRGKDVAWHAGNWYVNAKSVGLEHEGFLAEPDAWYTEAMYRSSARLVKYLAAKYDIPLDRQHILGHDNVPGHDDGRPSRGCTPTPARTGTGRTTSRCWASPSRHGRARAAALVTIRPDYDKHQPVYTGCVDGGRRRARRTVRARYGCTPRRDADAPLVKDIGLRPAARTRRPA